MWQPKITFGNLKKNATVSIVLKFLGYIYTYKKIITKLSYKRSLTALKEGPPLLQGLQSPPCMKPINKNIKKTVKLKYYPYRSNQIEKIILKFTKRRPFVFLKERWILPQICRFGLPKFEFWSDMYNYIQRQQIGKMLFREKCF